MSKETVYRVEYAKSGRSSCKPCKKPVEEGVVRCARAFGPSASEASARRSGDRATRLPPPPPSLTRARSFGTIVDGGPGSAWRHVDCVTGAS